MKIAMLGQKGIPALHGGPERHVEELAVRMVSRGHEVTVYTRPNYTAASLKTYRGVRLVSLPSVSTKHLDAISHVGVALQDALRHGFDVLHFQAEGPGLLAWVPRLVGTASVVTIHGQDWRREKWGAVATRALRVGEWVSMTAPDATIAVSQSLADELEARYRRPVTYIPNGVWVSADEDASILSDLGVEPGAYVLFAARLVPEKGCHYLVRAWRDEGLDVPLVVAGGSSFSDQYVAELHREAPRRVVFAGWVHGARLATLLRRAMLFVLPSDVEGLPIALLEALAQGTPVLASDIPPNLEAMDGWGATFAAGSTRDLGRKLRECLGDLPHLREEAGLAQADIARRYDWEVTVDRTLDVYRQALARR